ncbi:MAG: alpha/beta hydrolase [Anaerolineae bacterium]|nr:alpha/beta hydrolase [Anaerolineae bacterium]
MGLSKQTFTYKTVNHADLLIDVYDQPSIKPKPSIMWLHGGALILGSREMLSEEQAAFYLDAGYTLFAPDYRLAPETKLPEIISDLQTAYAWIQKHRSEETWG